MPPCGAPTASGRPCRRAVAEGRCHQHQAHVPAAPVPAPPPAAPAPPPPPQPCGRWCQQRGVMGFCDRPRAPGAEVCAYHRRIEVRRVENRAAHEAHRAEWLARADARQAAHEAHRAEFDGRLGHLRAQAAARAAAARPPVGQVGRFARDTQNVHTREVTQMIESFKLADESDRDGPELDEIEEAFARGRIGARLKRHEVLDDMERAWNTREQFGQLPFAYRRMLRVIWRRVKAHKERAELEKRLFEEVAESLQMCAQGHMGRLANVLQGFDEAAPPPPVPRGELLQNAMARIAGLPLAERPAEARKVFEELAVPDAERFPWLEALGLDDEVEEEPEPLPLVARLAAERLARAVAA